MPFDYSYMSKIVVWNIMFVGSMCRSIIAGMDLGPPSWGVEPIPNFSTTPKKSVL